MLLDPELHYLDNAATTMVDPEIAGAIHEALLKDWANPSSLYEPAVETHEALTTARGRLPAPWAARPRICILPPAAARATTLPCRALPWHAKTGAAKLWFPVLSTPACSGPSVH